MLPQAPGPNVPSLATLKDLPLPPPPTSYWPQAPGWWVLLALIVLALLVYAIRRAWRWWADRYRRAALLELDAIERDLAEPARRGAALEALPALVKRTVFTWAPRQRIAPMTGDAWLGFLDRTLPGNPFTAGPGQRLETIAYGGDALGNAEQDALLALLRRWIRDHVPA
ncbi:MULTISPECIES: DUF4381 domain-containing protein [Dyella]|nr:MULTISPECIES: DUF4381 domain-containing protein [Dyella]